MKSLLIILLLLVFSKCSSLRRDFKSHLNKHPLKKEMPKTKVVKTKVVKTKVVKTKVNTSKMTVSEIVLEEIVGKPFHAKYEYQVGCWKRLYKALIKAESGGNPYETYWEKRLGRHGYDTNTHMKYMSEGLMQLSYSDANYYKCNFDIEGDRNKKSDDKTKTIFDPKNNIACGVIILEKQLKIRKKVFSNKSYWSTLRPNNKANKRFKYYFKKYKSLCDK